MYGMKVKETTTGTGNSNLTLAGAYTNHVTAYATFGLNRLFSYFIDDATNNVWEDGIGYLSNSTTLVRDSVRKNSSGTTSPLTLSAGTKDVFCGPTSRSVLSDVGGMMTGGNLVFSMHLVASTTSTAPTANRMYYIPYFNTLTKPITHIGLIATTGAASKIASLGIYDIKNGAPVNLLRTHSGTIDMSATGVLTAALTSPLDLPVGWCFVGIVTDTTATIRSTPAGTQTKGCTFLGVDSAGIPNAHLYEALANSNAVPTTVGSLTLAQASNPQVGLIA